MNPSSFSMLAMHIPDGFLNLPVSLVGLVLSALLLVFAVGRVRSQSAMQRAPFIGALAALIFAAQMLNFPVLGGTSGHLVGAVLAAILLGPSAAFLTVTSVLVLQALVFHDGGILALGFNIVNMGLIGAFLGYAIYQACLRLLGDRAYSRSISVAIAAWASVVLGAVAVAFELAVSGTIPLNIALPAMVSVHMLIGLGEALITVGVIAIANRVQMSAPFAQRSSLGWVSLGVLAALAVTLMSPLASTFPDGLERVALDYGFAQRATSLMAGLVPDYALPFITDSAAATIGAGVLGVLILGSIAFAFAYGLSRNKPWSDIA